MKCAFVHCEGLLMHPVQFGIEPAMRVMNPPACASGAQAVAFRRCAPERLNNRASRSGRQWAQSLRLGSDIVCLDRIVGLDAMRLHGPSYSVLDGGRSLLLTHVLRHSPGALLWRNGWGGTSRLEPGSIFINQGRQDSLVEISPATPDEHCDCVRIVLRSDAVGDMAMRFEAHDFSFCNSPQACVRVMLGSYREHVARASPVMRLSMLDIDIAPFSEVEIPVANDELALAILTSGSLESSGLPVEPWHAVAFDGHEPSARLATQTGASVLWFGIPRRSTPVVSESNVGVA
jgi:hypothetical protein